MCAHGHFWCICQSTSLLWAAPQRWPQDPVANDEVKLLQVGSRSVLQHAVALQAALAVVQPLRHLRYAAIRPSHVSSAVRRSATVQRLT